MCDTKPIPCLVEMDFGSGHESSRSSGANPVAKKAIIRDLQGNVFAYLTQRHWKLSLPSIFHQ